MSIEKLQIKKEPLGELKSRSPRSREPRQPELQADLAFARGNPASHAGPETHHAFAESSLPDTTTEVFGSPMVENNIADHFDWFNERTDRFITGARNFFAPVGRFMDNTPVLRRLKPGPIVRRVTGRILLGTGAILIFLPIPIPGYTAAVSVIAMPLMYIGAILPHGSAQAMAEKEHPIIVKPMRWFVNWQVGMQEKNKLRRSHKKHGRFLKRAEGTP